MTMTGEWLRVTPYELALPGRDFVERRFPAILAEAEERGIDATDPAWFIQLVEVQEAIEEVLGESDGGRYQDHGNLLAHTWAFWRSGESVHLLDRASLDRLVASARKGEGAGPDDAPSAPRGPFPVPRAAGYLQFPLHRVWAQLEEEGRPESMDGFFWSVDRKGGLRLLFISGIQRDRPGFSIFGIPVEPLDGAWEWLDTPGREEGEDFVPLFEGGVETGMYALETGLEGLKLAALVLLEIAGSGEAGEEERSPSEEEAPANGPLPSRLPWRRVRSSAPPG